MDALWRNVYYERMAVNRFGCGMQLLKKSDFFEKYFDITGDMSPKRLENGLFKVKTAYLAKFWRDDDHICMNFQ